MSEDQEEQIKMAEDLLFSDKKSSSPSKNLFFGEFSNQQIIPYPEPEADELEFTRSFLEKLEVFLDQNMDPEKIDLEATISDELIKGLGDLGMMGLTIPTEHGGQNCSQYTYCQAMKKIAARCGGTAVFINAHQSIGLRAILLNGTEKQKSTFLKKLSSGEMLAAFALTEPEAGSDAANVQTRAVYDPEKKAFIINGEKRWITNGGIAGVLTLMCKTEVEGKDKVTAFLVTPDLPGFKVTEKAIVKCGIRGTTTSKLAFENMVVPEENILGGLGQGLKMALTVLDYGRLTFGASCTGAAEFLLQRTVEHAKTRVQFQKPLCSFNLVKQKIARMAAYTYAMDATTFLTAGFFDRDDEDVMLETAILKVFASDSLWMIVNEAIQIHGGKAFFCDEPFERMMRDARLNMIGEGSNEVLRVFIGLVGMRDVGLELKKFTDLFKQLLSHFNDIITFAWDRTRKSFISQPLECKSTELQEDCLQLGKDLSHFHRSVLKVLAKYKESVVDQQIDVNRIATASMSIYTSMAVLSKLDSDIQKHGVGNAQVQEDLKKGHLYIKLAHSKTSRSLRSLHHPVDELEVQLSDLLTDLKSD